MKVSSISVTERVWCVKYYNNSLLCYCHVYLGFEELCLESGVKNSKDYKRAASLSEAPHLVESDGAMNESNH